MLDLRDALHGGRPAARASLLVNNCGRLRPRRHEARITSRRSGPPTVPTLDRRHAAAAESLLRLDSPSAARTFGSGCGSDEAARGGRSRVPRWHAYRRSLPLGTQRSREARCRRGLGATGSPAATRSRASARARVVRLERALDHGSRRSRRHRRRDESPAYRCATIRASCLAGRLDRELVRRRGLEVRPRVHARRTRSSASTCAFRNRGAAGGISAGGRRGALDQAIPRLTDVEVLLGMQRLMARRLGDGHSVLYPFWRARHPLPAVPVRMYHFLTTAGSWSETPDSLRAWDRAARRVATGGVPVDTRSRAGSCQMLLSLDN